MPALHLQIDIMVSYTVLTSLSVCGSLTSAEKKGLFFQQKLTNSTCVY